MEGKGRGSGGPGGTASGAVKMQVYKVDPIVSCMVDCDDFVWLIMMLTGIFQQNVGLVHFYALFFSPSPHPSLSLSLFFPLLFPPLFPSSYT